MEWLIVLLVIVGPPIFFALTSIYGDKKDSDLYATLCVLYIVAEILFFISWLMNRN